MFGLFGNKNKRQELDDKYKEIATFVVGSLNSGGVGVINFAGALQMTKESLVKIKDNDLVKCRTNVVSLFVMMVAGDSASRDGEEVLARRICDACKSIAMPIMSVSPETYSNLEFSMVNNSLQFMRKIDPSIEVR